MARVGHTTSRGAVRCDDVVRDGGIRVWGLKSWQDWICTGQAVSPFGANTLGTPVIQATLNVTVDVMLTIGAP